MSRIVAFALCNLLAVSASAASFLPGFEGGVVTAALIGSTAIVEAPGGRFLVTTQSGAVRVVKDGVLLSDPAMTLTVDTRGERGLIGIAVDPDFANNGYVYLHHTVKGVSGPDAFGQVTRFTMVGDTLDETSGFVLQQFEGLNASNHNGGALRFGPDGQLYISVGDNSVGANAQDLTNRLGKILRIDPTTGAASAGNPFAGVPGVSEEIWAYGLRNPFKMDFSPESGELFINDVGQNRFEEINLGTAGANYGWPEDEGASNNADFTDPMFAYDHDRGDCAITGGAFYGKGSSAGFGASYEGAYFFGDFCSGIIYKMDTKSGEVTEFANSLGFGIVDLLVGSDGSLYYLMQTGTLGRIASVVPEPATAALLLGTAAAIGFRRRRQARPHRAA